LLVDACIVTDAVHVPARLAQSDDIGRAAGAEGRDLPEQLGRQVEQRPSVRRGAGPGSGTMRQLPPALPPHVHRLPGRLAEAFDRLSAGPDDGPVDVGSWFLGAPRKARPRP